MIPVFPAGDDGTTYTVNLTHAILENSTDMDLEPVAPQLSVNLLLTWTNAEGDPDPEPVELPTIDPDSTDVTAPNNRHFSFAHQTIADRKQPLTVEVQRQDKNTSDSQEAPRSSLLIFEPVPVDFAELPRENFLRHRQVGLIAVTEHDDNLDLDLDRVRIYRDEALTNVPNDNAPSAVVPDKVWSRAAPIRVVRMSEATVEASVLAIQDKVTPLDPCQEFLEDDESRGGARCGCACQCWSMSPCSRPICPGSTGSRFIASSPASRRR